MLQTSIISVRCTCDNSNLLFCKSEISCNFFLRSKLLLWHKSLQWFCNVFWRWHDYYEGCWTFYKAYEIKNYANQNHSVSMCIKFHFKAWIFWHFWQAARCSKRLSKMTVEARTYFFLNIPIFSLFFRSIFKNTYAINRIGVQRRVCGVGGWFFAPRCCANRLICPRSKVQVLPT